MGTGNANTNNIVSYQVLNANYADKICYDLVLNGYSDWYLPSKDELNILYLNQISIGVFNNASYWSSTQYLNQSTGAGSGGWYQSFGSGIQGWNVQFTSGLHNVRAVRSF